MFMFLQIMIKGKMLSSHNIRETLKIKINFIFNTTVNSLSHYEIIYTIKKLFTRLIKSERKVNIPKGSLETCS